ncbi:MAG: hypothetical protein ABI411_10915 [Tahibacter sp.]
MNTMLAASGTLALLIGIVHSVLGEVLMFRHLRRGGFVPTLDATPLRERHVRILWATWHLATVFGWAFAGILFAFALSPGAPPSRALVVNSVVFANLAGSILVLVGTKGRHPGWFGLLLVAVLAWYGAGGA